MKTDHMCCARPKSSFWESRRATVVAIVVVAVIVGGGLHFMSIGARRADAATSPGSVLAEGEVLQPGQYLTSASGQYRLLQQTDGNLVVQVASSGRPLWSAGTSGHPGAAAWLQPDGNFVIYPASGPSSPALWSTQTRGSGNVVGMADNGIVSVFSAGGHAIWSSGGPNAILAEGEVLQPGQYLTSASGQYRLLQQTDGNLVVQVASSGRPLWSAGTSGHPGAAAWLQPDGNFVIYPASGPSSPALWSTQTWGSGNVVGMADNGIVSVFSAGGQAIWSGVPNVSVNGTWGMTEGSDPFPYGQCTYGAEEAFHSHTGTYMAVTGNAYQWAGGAAQNGWTVVNTPTVNSVVVFQRGVDGADRTYGHVAWVVAVNGSQVEILEMNGAAGPGKYDYRWVSSVPGVSYILVP